MIQLTTAEFITAIGIIASLATAVVALLRDRTKVRHAEVTGEAQHDQNQDQVVLRLIEVISTLNENLTRFADNYEKNTEAQIQLSSSVKELVRANLEDRQFFREALRDMAQQINDIHEHTVKRANDG